MLAWLLERFGAAHNQPAVIWRDRQYSYGWLLDRMGYWRGEMERLRVAPGSVVAIEGDYSPDTCALLLTLIDWRAVVVPLTSTVEASKPRFLEVAEVQDVFSSHGSEWRHTRRGVSVTHPRIRTLIDTGDPGLVLFSSGSTGEPKAALHNFARLLDKFQVRRHSLCTITFLLLDHIGGMNTLFYILSNTGVLVAVEDRSPDAVCAAIDRHQVELLPTSPTFLNLLLLSEAYTRHDLSSLKQITYGTEPMPETTLRRLHEVLPAVTLLQTYGLSELGILRSKSKGSDSLWVRIGGEGFETKVVDGILWIRAHSAMLGYLNAPSPFDADGWFNTGDEVMVDGDYLRIVGRRSELINVGGEKVYPAEVESVLLELENVRDVVVKGQPNPLTGQIVVASFNLAEPEEMASLRRRVREHCRGRLTPYKIPAKIEIVSEAQYSQRFKKTRRHATRASR